MVGGKIGTQVKLTVRHYDGKVASYTLTREEVREPIVKGYQRNQDNTWITTFATILKLPTYS